jgi:hypothetical protein
MGVGYGCHVADSCVQVVLPPDPTGSSTATRDTESFLDSCRPQGHFGNRLLQSTLCQGHTSFAVWNHRSGARKGTQGGICESMNQTEASACPPHSRFPVLPLQHDGDAEPAYRSHSLEVNGRETHVASIRGFPFTPQGSLCAKRPTPVRSEHRSCPDPSRRLNRPGFIRDSFA